MWLLIKHNVKGRLAKSQFQYFMAKWIHSNIFVNVIIHPCLNLNAALANIC